MSYITEEEKNVLNLLVNCYNAYLQLVKESPHDMDADYRDFRDCIRTGESVIMRRIARRAEPELFEQMMVY